MATATPDIRLVNSLKEKIRVYQTDPGLFVREILYATPTKQQEEIFASVKPRGSRTSCSSGHGVGKSTTQAWMILWFVSCFDDCKVPCTAPSSHQLKDVLWAEVAKWHQKMHPWFREQINVTTDRVEIVGAEQTRFAVARTARRENPDALHGFHATNLFFLIDEASGVDENVFTVAEGALSTPGCRVLMTANPTRTVGYFYDSWHGSRSRWKRLRFSCLDSPLVDIDYPLDMAAKYGVDSDIYRVRVLGEFPSASIVQLIPRPLIEQSMRLVLRPEQFNFSPKVLGVDVAWEGDDRSVVVMRQGLHSEILGEWRKIDNMTLAGMVAQYQDRHKPEATFIDVGWGTGVIDRLRQLGRHPVPVNFGSKSSNERYSNKRTEMWVGIKEWLESGGSIPPNADLADDLAGPEYSFAPNGKIILERKKDMKKRGLASPDIGDALALTFAEPVRKLTAMEKLRGKKVDTVQTEYDLFG